MILPIDIYYLLDQKHNRGTWCFTKRFYSFAGQRHVCKMLWNKIIHSCSGEILQTYKDTLKAVLDFSQTANTPHVIVCYASAVTQRSCSGGRVPCRSEPRIPLHVISNAHLQYFRQYRCQAVLCNNIYSNWFVYICSRAGDLISSDRSKRWLTRTDGREEKHNVETSFAD